MSLPFSEPPLSTRSAHFLAGAFAATYVGSLYISKNARLVFTSDPVDSKTAGKQRRQYANERWRDDPAVIRARLLAVTIATLVNCIALLVVIWTCISDEQNERLSTAVKATLTRLGLNDWIFHLFSNLYARYTSLPPFSAIPLSIYAHMSNMLSMAWTDLFQYIFVSLRDLSNAQDIQWIYPHLITPVLFLGPLFAKFLASTLPFQRFWSWSDLWDVVTSWVGVRNYMLAPFTEEVVFRACILSVYALSDASRKTMIFGAPMWFGLAHIHHAWDTYNRYGRTSAAAKRALLSTAFQLMYTTLFGAYTSYLFLRTSSLAPVVSAHIFCNIMGLPMITSEIEQSRGKGMYIITAYIIGIFMFATQLSSWTRVEDALYWS